MIEQGTKKQEFTVSIREPEEPGGPFVFAVTPERSPRGKGNGSALVRAPQYVVAARQDSSGLGFDWEETPDDPGAARADIETEIRARMKDRAAWIDRMTSLVGQVEQWARERGWSTRRIEKKLEDPWIGPHRVPALLVQRDLCRILLEPLGPSAQGSEGVVDLYLMPAYDDIARIVYRGENWHVRYFYPEATGAARGEEAKLFSKEVFLKIVAGFEQHAV